jgi:predicted esterase
MLGKAGPRSAMRRGLIALARPLALAALLAALGAAVLALGSLGLPVPAIGSLLGMRAAHADAPSTRPSAPPPAPAPRAEPAPPAPPPLPAGPVRLAVDGRAVVAAPPSRALGAAARVSVVLHGMCSDPEPMCSLYATVDRGASWLLCPAGNGSCSDGSPDWAGPPASRAADVDAALDALARDLDPGAAARPALLAGYSRGAFTARDLALLRPGRYAALVLLSAAISPDPARLRAAGVRRVLLAAGDLDGAHASMQRTAQKLTAAGLPAT